ncbi:MAG: hypothetical protein NTZ68_04435 [Candidatus Dependentiae bacterium]|nr:hypothetical protein [Candidatus Dependentiae bacterium]
MLKTIKKALLLSSFVFASVLPMRQVGQVALANALPIRKVAQIALAKLVNQSASFHNSSVARSPFVFGTLSAMPHMDVDESVDKSTEESIDESADEPVEMDNQDVGTNHRVFFDNNTKSWGVDLHGGAGAPDLRRFLPNDVTQDRSSSNDREQAECLSEIKDDLKLAYKEQARFEYDESQYSYYVEKFPTIIQDKACELVKSYSSLSRHELSSEHNTLSSTRKILEEKLQSLAQKNTNVWHIVQEAQYGFNSVVIPYCDRSRWKGKDYDYVLATLDLISDIESIKVATRECDARISKFDQEARDFVSALERSSSDVIEEKIMPGLMGKKEKNAFCIAQKEDELNHQKNKLKDINAQIESFNNRSIWVRGKARFKELFDSNQNPDDIKKGLEDDKKDLKAEIAKTSRQLQSLYHQQKEYDSQVVQAQKIVQEKRKIELQEAQILEEKKAETGGSVSAEKAEARCAL